MTTDAIIERLLLWSGWIVLFMGSAFLTASLLSASISIFLGILVLLGAWISFGLLYTLSRVLCLLQEATAHDRSADASSAAPEPSGDHMPSTVAPVPRASGPRQPTEAP
ncbi:DUF3784 domain-containing protein [Salisaeta longa]|uniref:DUF3784 domain-containing protein n=1 Tax=Salisaeta longa TaxID=503170 RepID=UPI0003B401D8|nr:DUF3784 domain-containing protein [Salisaeta longa]